MKGSKRRQQCHLCFHLPGSDVLDLYLHNSSPCLLGNMLTVVPSSKHVTKCSVIPQARPSATWSYLKTWLLCLPTLRMASFIIVKSHNSEFQQLKVSPIRNALSMMLPQIQLSSSRSHHLHPLSTTNRYRSVLIKHTLGWSFQKLTPCLQCCGTTIWSASVSLTHIIMPFDGGDGGGGGESGIWMLANTFAECLGQQTAR